MVVSVAMVVTTARSSIRENARDACLMGRGRALRAQNQGLSFESKLTIRKPTHNRAGITPIAHQRAPSVYGITNLPEILPRGALLRKNEFV